MKPKLKYVAFFTNEPVRPAEYLEKYIITPLAQRGLFMPTSEVLSFHRSPFGGVNYSMNVFPVNDKGDSKPVGVFSCWCEPSDFHERNRQIYIDFLAQGGDIFPIYFAGKTDRRQVRLIANVIDLPTGNKAPLGQDEFEYTNLQSWEDASEALLRTYLEANRDPHLRLAIIHTAKKHSRTTLDHFLSVAGKVSQPEEIKVRPWDSATKN